MEVVQTSDFDYNSPLARGFPLIEPIIAVNPGAGPESPCEVTGDPRTEWLTVTKRRLIEEYRKKKNLDVTLVVDDGTVMVHRAVICKFFEIFHDLFEDNKRGYNVVRIFSANLEAVEATLDYLYFGKATVKDRSLPTLLKFIKCLEYPTMYCHDPVRIYLVRCEHEARDFIPMSRWMERAPPPPPRRRVLSYCRAGAWGRGRQLFLCRHEPHRMFARDLCLGLRMGRLEISLPAREKIINRNHPLATLPEEDEEEKKQK